MNRPTLSAYRAQFPSEAFGICQADPRVAAYANDAMERLMFDPLCPEEGWWGGWATMAINGSVNNGYSYVTTPRDVARLIVMGVCNNPVPIRNGFYQFLQFGAGLQPKTCNTSCGQTLQMYERDNVFTLSDLVGTKTIRIYPTDPRDIGLRVLVQGKDANGQVILTTDPGTGLSAPGEYIVIASPFANSTYQFTSISGIQKDETFGNVQLFQVDGNGVELPLSAMEPNEGAANYRRYLLNGIPNINSCCTAGGLVQITAQARLEFIPVQSETDYLFIPNVPALLEEAQSLRYSRMDSMNAAQQTQVHHARAIALLNGQLDLYSGKVSTAINVPLFGSDRLHRAIV